VKWLASPLTDPRQFDILQIRPRVRGCANAIRAIATARSFHRLGGAAAWPLAARAQQPGPMRRVGVLMNTAEDAQQSQARVAAFKQALQQPGWSDGRNVRFDIRWGASELLPVWHEALSQSWTLRTSP
jgi:hypothetical protein